jgi:hypothetical protein
MLHVDQVYHCTLTNQFDGQFGMAFSQKTSI